MSKNQTASGLTNFIQYDSFGNIKFVSGSNTLMTISASGAITTTGTISGSAAANATSASYAATASYASAFTVGGTLTAQTLVVQTITSSIDYVTGSTVWGSIIGNTHQITGSVQTSGSAYFLGNMSIGGSTLTGYKLQLQGSPGADVIFSISSSGAAAPYIYMDGTLNSYNAIRFRHSGSDYFAMGAVNGNITNNLSFYYNGYSSVAMSISSSGAVGIGTTTPGYSLDLLASSWKSLRIQANDDVMISMGSTVASSQYWIIGTTASGSAQGGNMFFIGANPNNPSGVLTKNFSIASTGAATFSSSVTLNGGNNADIYRTNTSGNSYLWLDGGGTTGAEAGIVLKNNGTSKYELYTAANDSSFNIYSYASGNYTMRLSSTGITTLVSIDTSGNRTTMNDVLILSLTNNNAPYSGFGSSILFKGTTYNSGGTGISGIRNWGRIGMTLTDSSFGTTGENMIFQVAASDNSDTLSTAMLLQYNGKLGINNVNPITRLHVIGPSEAALAIQTGSQSWTMFGKMIQTFNNGTAATLFTTSLGGNTGIMVKVVIRGTSAVSSQMWEDVGYAYWRCLSGTYQASGASVSNVTNIVGNHTVGTLAWTNPTTMTPTLTYTQGANSYCIESLDVYVVARDSATINMNADYVNQG